MSRLSRILVLLIAIAAAAGFGAVAMLAQNEPTICAAEPVDALLDGVWTQGAPMPTARSELGSAVWNGKIYVVGGLYRFGVSAAFEVYDIAADTWETLPPLPVGIHHPGVAALDGVIYVAGGYPDLAFTPDNRLWAYDVEAGEWAQLADLPSGQGAHGLVAIEDKLYLVGGVPQEVLWAYDPARDTWDDSLTPMALPREHLGATAYDGKLYVAGGRWSTRGNQRLFEVYDPQENAWEQLPDLPTRRGGISAAAVDGRIYVGGGEDFVGNRGCTFNRAEVYDVETDSWARTPDMPRPRHGITSVAFEGRWYILGGALGAGPQTTNTSSDVIDIFMPADHNEA